MKLKKIHMEKVPLRFLPSLFLNLKEITFSFDIWGWVPEWLSYYFVYVLKFDYFTGKAILITLFTWNYCINVRNKTITIWLLRVENFCFRSKQEVVKEMPQCGKKNSVHNSAFELALFAFSFSTHFSVFQLPPHSVSASQVAATLSSMWARFGRCSVRSKPSAWIWVFFPYFFHPFFLLSTFLKQYPVFQIILWQLLYCLDHHQ